LIKKRKRTRTTACLGGWDQDKTSSTAEKGEALGSPAQCVTAITRKSGRKGLLDRKEESSKRLSERKVRVGRIDGRRGAGEKLPKKLKGIY